MFAGILEKVGEMVVSLLWAKIEAKLEKYFETKSQIKKISTEAGALKDELKNASNDSERAQILRKISDFSERIGH